MKAFMDKVFLLSIEPASQLYHDFVENLPIIWLSLSLKY